MYKEARNAAGLTLEKAAERLGVDPRTLTKYESGALPVRPEMALKMGEVYGQPETLPRRHCAERCPIGRILRPVFQAGNIASDTLRLLKELRDVNERVANLVEVAADGEVQPDEVPEFKATLKELSELGEAIEKIKLLAAKLTARGAGEAKAA